MSIRVSGKHMEVGEAFRTRIEDRLGEAVAKYFDGNFSASVVVAKDGSSRFACDCVIHLDTGVVFQSQSLTHDPEASFADACEKLDKRLRRYKRRLKDHHANGGHKALAYQIMEAIPDETEEVPEDYAPAIIAETTLSVGTLSVAGAVMELDRQDGPLVLFRNSSSGDINIVFRRTDGNVGWVDPSTYARET